MKQLWSRREMLCGMTAMSLAAPAWPLIAVREKSQTDDVLHPALRKFLDLQGRVVVDPLFSCLTRFSLEPHAWSKTPSVAGPAEIECNRLAVATLGDKLRMQAFGKFFTGILWELGASSRNPSMLPNLAPQEAMDVSETCIDRARGAGLILCEFSEKPAVIDENLLRFASQIQRSQTGTLNRDFSTLERLFVRAGRYDVLVSRFRGGYRVCISPSAHTIDWRGTVSYASMCIRPLLFLEQKLRPLPSRTLRHPCLDMLELICEVESQTQVLSILSTTSQCKWNYRLPGRATWDM